MLMNPKYLLIPALIGLLCDSFAQQAYQTLEANNIGATVGNDAQLFYVDFLNPSARPSDPLVLGYEYPKGSGKHTIFAGQLGMGTLDADGNIRTMNRGSFSNIPDIQAGPLMNPSLYPFESFKWNRVWKVSRAEIDVHIRHIGEATYAMPEAIENWPAHGDTDKGMMADLAPFIDVDNNGMYEPEQGDYPAIRGDECILFMYNDDVERSVFGEQSLGIQIVGMLYSFQCTDNEAIDHSTFLHYELKRSPNATGDFTDAYVSFWTDMDIGNPGDDYIDSDVNRGAFYGYNGDAMDEDRDRVLGYGAHPPAQAFMVLRGPLQDADGVDNASGAGPAESVNGIGFGDGIVDNEYLGMTSFSYERPGQFNPGGPIYTENEVFYNGMQGKKPDGEYLNMLYTPDSILVPSRFFHYGDTDPLGYATNGLAVISGYGDAELGNTPSDRIGYGNSGPFTMGAQETVELDFAFVTGHDPNGGVEESVENLRTRMDLVRTAYTDGITTCGKDFGFYTGAGQVTPVSNSINAYPNPFTDIVSLQLDGLSNVPYQVLDVVGKVVRSGILTNDQTPLNLSDLTPGTYLLQLQTTEQPQTIRLVKR